MPSVQLELGEDAALLLRRFRRRHGLSRSEAARQAFIVGIEEIERAVRAWKEDPAVQDQLDKLSVLDRKRRELLVESMSLDGVFAISHFRGYETFQEVTRLLMAYFAKSSELRFLMNEVGQLHLPVSIENVSVPNLEALADRYVFRRRSGHG